MIAEAFDRLVRTLRPSISINDKDQADIDRMREVQNHLAQSIELANLHDDPLRFPLRAVSEIAEVLQQTQIKTRQLLHDAMRAADQVSRPTEILRAQLVKSFQALAWEQRLRFALMAGILYASGTTTVGVIFAWALIEAHRDTPEAAALRTAAAGFSTGWTTVMLQNDLPSMLTACTKSPGVAQAPNGRHYCYIPLSMDGVQAEPLPDPAWSQNVVRGAPR